MTEYDYNTEAVFVIQLHIVLVTKNRQSILNGPVKRKLRDVIRNICDEQQVEIISGNISHDHVHLVISISPKTNINKFILLLKGKTTYALFTTYADLKDRYYNRHLWGKGCFCHSSGDVNDETIQRYVEQQTPPDTSQVATAEDTPAEPSPAEAPEEPVAEATETYTDPENPPW